MASNVSEDFAGSSDERVVGIDRKIPFAEKLFFPAIGGIGAFFNSVVQIYLLYYYTNILKSALFVGSMFVIVQIITAAMSPVFGAFMDRHTTRWGKYRPWIFIFMSGMALALLLVFIPVNFGPTGNLVYAALTYTAFSLFSSMNQAAQTGITVAMTKRQDDRITISLSRNIWFVAGSMLVAYIVLPLVNTLGRGNQAAGFPLFILLSGIIFVILTLLITKMVKERFVISAEKQAKFSLRLLAQTLFKNKYARIAIAYSLVLNLCVIRTIMNFYYCVYYFHDTNMTATMIFWNTLPVIIGLLVSPVVIKLLGLKKSMLIMVIVSIITSAAIFLMPATAAGAIAVEVLTAVGFLFIGIARPAQTTMMPFAADYSEWKDKMNSGGFLGALNGFIDTLNATVIRSALALFVGLIGFVPNSEQSAATIFGIRSSVSLIPAVLFIVLAFIISRWDLTEKKYSEMVHETWHAD